LITAKDHASVQINIGNVDENGVYTGTYETVAFCGKVRYDGKADNAMNEYALKKKIMKDVE
jgi:small subunit ribosomal protein S21e